MYVCDDISACRRRVCMCDDISMLVYCVCGHMTGAIWRTSSPFPIDTGLPPNMVRLSVL